MKYIVIICFCILIIISGYYLFKLKSSNQPDSRPNNKCKYGVDKDGKCIVPELCGNNVKPLTKCADEQQLICDKNLPEPDWRCKLKCESETNKFPYDFSKCDDISKIKCDSNGKYYCDSDYCKNGGILYSGNSKCSCDSSKFIGDRCECDISKCQGGIADPTSCKCTSCCNDSTSASLGPNKLCKYYGDNCENKCELDNYFYDDVQKMCVCPDGYKLDSQKNCIPIDCGKNGTLSGNKCICNEGFTGDNCDAPICIHGTWNPSTKMCDCNKDQNGNPLAAGDTCKYSRQGFCNGNGYPVVENGVPSCICDNNFVGDHCTCNISEKPTGDKCNGLVSICEETNATNDDNRSGNWNMSYLSCNNIYSTYGDSSPDKWRENCTSSIADDQSITYPDYKAYCEPIIPAPKSPNDPINKFYYTKTCNIKPDESDLVKCRQGLDINGKVISPNGCYVWSDYINTGTLPSGMNSYCKCDQDINGDLNYYCQPITNINDCGKMPPSGACKVGDKNEDPICFSYQDGVRYAYVCPSGNLPQDYLKDYFRLTLSNTSDDSNDSNDKWWYSNKENASVFPSINMDKCIDYNENNNTDVNMYTTLDNPGYNQGYQYINPNSTHGYISGSTFYYPNDPKIITYNYRNPVISSDDTKISDGKNAYPSYNSLIQDAGCASFRKPYNPSSGDIQSSCAVNSDGSSRANSFQQLCATVDGLIQKNENGDYICDKNSYYVTNTGKCDCSTYYSVPQNSNYAHYKGRYCQYDDTMCNNQGLIDDNGICTCILYDSNSQKIKVNYKGDKCQYDDNKNCNGLGIVDNNGNCDFNAILNNVSNYIASNPSDIKSGDIVIIEYIAVGPPIGGPQNPPYNLLPQNKFISQEISSDPLTVSYNNPIAFEVQVISDNNLRFRALNKDAKDINTLNQSDLYLFTDKDNKTDLSTAPSTYTLAGQLLYDGESFQLSSTDGFYLLCDYPSSNLIIGNDIWHQTAWKIHKLNLNYTKL